MRQLTNKRPESADFQCSLPRQVTSQSASCTYMAYYGSDHNGIGKQSYTSIVLGEDTNLGKINRHKMEQQI